MINTVFISGNLTADPELNYLPNGTAICKFQVAINSKRKGPDGKDIDEVDFIPVGVWAKQAEACGEYLHKGSKVVVQGKLKQERWEDKTTGEKKSKIGVIAWLVQFMDAKPASAGAPAAPAAAPAAEDDIPF